MTSIRQTKIIATLGPACYRKTILKKMFRSGVDVIRLNASHFSDPEKIKEAIVYVREQSVKFGKPVGLFLDLQGPKIRVGEFENEGVVLQDGQQFQLVGDIKCLGTSSRVGVSCPEIVQDLRKGDTVFIDDGKVRLEVIKKQKLIATCQVVRGGRISNNKGINLPVTKTSLSVLTTKDKANLKVAVEMGVDYVALSFVSDEKDVKKLRVLMNRLGGKDIGIIAKIERRSAVDNIEAIVDVSDIIMVARGDLGVEIGIEKVPEVQKMIIRLGKRRVKPVIVATQMLESMVTTRMATRAEVSDVANAIYDGCDVVMLSGETAVGIDPVNVIDTMVDICVATDFHRSELKKVRYSQVRRIFDVKSMATSFCKAADQIADENDATVLLAFTSSGNTALISSKLNPSIPIIAPTDSLSVLHKMAFYRGVIPQLMVEPFVKIQSWSKMIELAIQKSFKEKLIKKGDRVLVTAGIPIGQSGGTNSIRMIDV
ncbi:pyruvate kinase [Candidatus Marinamargulisbacteria bacterium SCGC AG-439-L15]|nr:pyruvate kinase [Candidatus Marinamargulisbacteria bacterium SCGC AG-439-L15]